MDTLQLVPFEAGEKPRIEDVGSSDFRSKELRIKDLYKRLCKKRTRDDWRASNSTTSAAVPLKRNGEQRHSSAEAPIVDSEVSETEGMALVPRKARSRSPAPSQSKEPSKRVGKRETQLPVKYRDDEFSQPVLFSEKHFKPSPKRGTPIPKVKRARLPPVVAQRNRPQFFDVPISSFEANDRVSHAAADHSPSTPFNQRPSPSRPTPKQSNVSPASTSRRSRHPRRSRASIDNSVCVEELSSNPEPSEERSRILESITKKNQSPHVKLSQTSLDARKVKSVSSKGRAAERKVKQSEQSPVTRKAKSPVATKMKSPVVRKAKSVSTGGNSMERKTKLSQNSLDARKTKSASTRRIRIPIRKLRGGYTSEDDGTSEVELDVDGEGVTHPTFVVEMKHSNVITCFWLSIPAEFDQKHLPDCDHFIELQDSEGLKWETNYLARKRGLSGGWRRFAVDHCLEMGDLVVFELVKPLKFQTHITRVSEGGRSIVTARESAKKEVKKKVKKPQFNAGRTKSPSLHSALFSARKRVNRDVSHTIFPRKKAHLASSEEGEDDPVPVRWMTPSTKPQMSSSRTRKQQRFVKTGSSRETSSEESDQDEIVIVSPSSEESEDEEEQVAFRWASQSKFKRLSDVEDALGGRNDDRKSN